METMFFLSSLPDDLYQMVLDVLKKYGKLEIKGQRAKKKDLNSGLKTAIDCPIYNFKCLRGDLTYDEIRCLLEDLTAHKVTFAELKQEASHLKEIKEVQRQFITKTGSENWKEVTERYADCLPNKLLLNSFIEQKCDVNVLAKPASGS